MKGIGKKFLVLCVFEMEDFGDLLEFKFGMKI